jgi:DNA-directed RNA polymerase specialized sigma24 family protein
MASMQALTDEDYQRAFRYARSLGADRDLALDLVQTAIVKALAAAREDIEAPVAYLLTSVRHAFYSEIRREKTAAWSSLEDFEGVIATDMQPLEDMVMARDTLRHAWAVLSPPEREVLHLWAEDRLDGAELASLHRLAETPAIPAAERPADPSRRRWLSVAAGAGIAAVAGVLGANLVGRGGSGGAHANAQALAEEIAYNHLRVAPLDFASGDLACMRAA